MTNETMIECYCRSEQMAKLCQGSKDIVIRFKASYPPNKKPVFKIYAEVYHRKGGKGGKPVPPPPPPPKGGNTLSAAAIELCPTPCHPK